jgi:hypothetical protein
VACIVCHQKGHFISYRTIANMFSFVQLTGIASLGEMCLKTSISSLIYSAPNCPIKWKLLPNNSWTYYYECVKLQLYWVCTWYGKRCQSRLKVEIRPTLRPFSRSLAPLKNVPMTPAYRSTFIQQMVKV